jgi:phenylalanyl-tRNA synthetase beta chain
MKFTLSWLRDHLETEATLDEIAEALTDLGLEVEAIDDPAARLGAFRIARILEARPHPDADRLRLCRVEVLDAATGGSSEVQVVCGAPNARTGLVGVFAPVGTHIPGTGVDLKPGMIRGEASNGMMCRSASWNCRTTTRASSSCPPTRRWACATSTGPGSTTR